MHLMDVRRVLTAFWSRSTAVFGLAFLALFVQSAQAQGSLNYFKNYFVTGDYVVGGVGLYGKKVSGPVTGAVSVTGNITLNSVPCTTGPGLFASVIPCSAKGALPADVIAAFLYWQTVESTTTPSSAIGSYAGSFNAASPVNPFVGLALGNPQVPACSGGGTSAQFLHVYRADVLKYLPVNSTANVRVANGTQTFTLVSGDTTTQFVGATLVVVYRLVTPGNPRIAPLRSVVIYDGAFTGTQSLSLNQTMGGFYQASFDPDAKMTHIVGNGQSISNRKETQTLLVNGGIPQGVPSDPFQGAQGANWDNYTFNYNLSPNASSVETQVPLALDCLSWGAIINSTNVQDSDMDGLLDIWETSGLALNPGVRNDGTTTPPVPATFGTCAPPNASSCVNLPKMGANPFVPDIFVQIDWMTGTYGAPHTHNPQLAALNMVGAAFKSHGVNLHFDVGNNYQTQPASPYIVPVTYAQGGNVIQESGNLLCPNSLTSTCAFPTQSDEYSVLGWKSGFNAIKNGDSLSGVSVLPQLFALNRKDTFHYALFGHAIAATTPLSAPLAGSISGVGDLPGGDLMVTLGLWRSDIPSVDQVGTVLEQAGTLMHELGHNLDLKHGGWNNTPVCMPNYPSVMNYLYQVQGLTDSAGNEHIDYSYGLELPMSEDFLSSLIPMGLQQYRVRYFAPFNSATNTPGQASQVDCNGQILSGAEGQYVRLESPAVSTPDWSNGTVHPLGKLITSGLDINYDGIVGETFFDQPDWLSVNLQQVGARPNADALSLNVGISDIGISDIGISDIGISDIGISDIGISDIGISDIGISDIGTAQLGQDALGDQDFTTFVLSGVTPPTALVASVYVPSTTGGTGNQLNWTPPTAGQVLQYNIYRCNASGGACTPGSPAIANIPGGTPTPTFTDTVNDFVDAGTTCPATKTCYNTTYNYYVTAVVSAAGKNVESGPSNTASSEVNHLFVMGNISSPAIVYGAANPAITVNIYGNVAGSLTASQVTCVYSPAPPRNVMATPYAIVCSGPATTSTADGVTYNANYLSYSPSTLTITPRPITVTAAASSRGYDGLTDSTAVPTITTGSLAFNDTVTWTESYDNKNVGTTHLMTPAGTVNDTNGGKNYTVMFVTISTGVIKVAPLTIAAVPFTKPYDGNTAAPAATPMVTGLQTGDSVSPLVETYANKNAGPETLSVTTYTIIDGNNGNNYSPVNLSTAAGTISPAPLTGTVQPAFAIYGAVIPSFSVVYTGFVNSETAALVTGTLSCSSTAVANSPVGGYQITCSGQTAPNYAIAYIPGTLMITQASTTTAISSVNPSPGMVNQPVTVTVTVAPQYGGTPSGTVTVSSGAGGPTCTTPPLSAATANCQLTFTTAGPESITATYNGDLNFFGSTTAAATPLTVKGLVASITAANKPPDGTTTATITSCTLTGVAPADAGNVTCIASGGTFASASVGTWQVTANVTLAGPAAGNYSLSSPTATTTANINPSIDFTTLALNGTASPAAPVVAPGPLLRLTNNMGDETSSAWFTTELSVASGFSTSFDFQITPAATFPNTNSIADGFAFVIQAQNGTTPPNGTATLGLTTHGGFIGYDGIPNSIAIEFDTYSNPEYSDPSGTHIGIQSLGTLPNSTDHNPATGANRGGPVQVNFADGNPHNATITYDGTTLSVFVDGTFVVSAPVALNSLLSLDGGTNAFVGFTAATGAAQENSDILAWSLN